MFRLAPGNGRRGRGKAMMGALWGLGGHLTPIGARHGARCSSISCQAALVPTERSRL